MNRIPEVPPKILPLPKNLERPLWSVMIPVYNCSRFIPDVLNSVLRQDPGEDRMQIEVVDDASTDEDVEALVNEIGKGRVKYYRQKENVGSLRNFETCINRSQGKIIHLLHGDDRVKESFYTKMADLMESYPEAGAGFCRYVFIDQNGFEGRISKFEEGKDGILENAYHKIILKNPIQYAGIVIKREVYEDLGGFFGVVNSEDWEMWVRIAKNYPMVYTPEPLAEYRRYLGQISKPKRETGQNVMDKAKSIATIEKQLPENEKHLLDPVKLKCANRCINVAKLMVAQGGDPERIKELIKLSLNLSNASFKLYLRIFKFYLNKALKIN